MRLEVRRENFSGIGPTSNLSHRGLSNTRQMPIRLFGSFAVFLLWGLFPKIFITHPLGFLIVLTVIQSLHVDTVSLNGEDILFVDGHVSHFRNVEYWDL